MKDTFYKKFISRSLSILYKKDKIKLFVRKQKIKRMNHYYNTLSKKDFNHKLMYK